MQDPPHPPPPIPRERPLIHDPGYLPGIGRVFPGSQAEVVKVPQHRCQVTSNADGEERHHFVSAEDRYLSRGPEISLSCPVSPRTEDTLATHFPHDLDPRPSWFSPLSPWVGKTDLHPGEGTSTLSTAQRNPGTLIAPEGDTHDGGIPCRRLPLSTPPTHLNKISEQP